MVHPKEVVAIILAAGRSSRMERFKPLLPINGRRLIEQVAENILAAGIAQIRVVVGHQADKIVPVLDGIGIAWVKNPDYRLEMFSSIKVGIERLDAKFRAFFLQPGDMPFVRPETYQALVSRFDPERWDILRPRHKKRAGHPVLISRSRIDAISAYQGAGGMRALMKRENWRIENLDGDDPGILIDLNRPEDYEKALCGTLGKR